MPPAPGGSSAALVAALRDPAAYSPAPSEVEFLETHISWLFFAGDRVYKVKKPVNLGFLDYSTLERRRELCREEVRLNRRLAPHVYLGTVPIRGNQSGASPTPLVGVTVGGTGSGPVVEWAVEMVRLPAERMLSELLDRGEIDNQAMNDLADLLVDFHAHAATGPGVDEHGDPATVRRHVAENREQLEPFAGELDPRAVPNPLMISQAQLRHLDRSQTGFLDEQLALFARRVKEHRIRDCHGDLHAGNVCFTDTGIVAYDCIEFAASYRAGDVASDLAFLAMDIDQRGFPSFSRYLARRYAERADDAEFAAIEPFYRTYRAIVRGKVTAFAAAGCTDPTQRQALACKAMRYLQLATAYELPPALVVLCGLPATGKSFLAKRIARPLRAVVLQSDVRRKVLAGGLPTQSAAADYGAGLYTPEKKRATYRSLLEQAVEMLTARHSVIVDATFARREYRAPFIDAAVRLQIPYYLVHVTAPDALVRERLAQRALEPTSTSDADVTVYERARDSFEPPTEVPAGHVLELVSDGRSPELHSALLLDRMIARP